MNPKHYTPHCLRIGGCTDWARQGKPAWKIERQGRWSSRMWKKTYVNMDWNDIANLHGCTVGDLLKGITEQPYSED